ncbi:hypothetical protein MVEN_00984700 [Mycena venus]|uniref:Uncharacterized protein n=1 Tax=Mycena venus TaxID=2733690 RepID=A0A8H6YDH9_9AGAR|nr:hypothetical protein MVEN_00984700 [Mycena venus]
MSKELPLKVRVDIRDQWDSPNSSVHASVSSLNKILGHTITPHVEWPILWGAVKEQFSDNTTFVPLVVRYTIAWYERLMGRLENPTCEQWTEQLLNIIAESPKAKALSLHIEPAEGAAVLPSTKWNAKLATFQLYIPKADPVSQLKLDSTYDKCFENLFEAKDEGWADLATETHVSVAPTAGATSSSSERPYMSRLPVLDALSRPPDLFKSTAPYTLIVEERSPNILVQCSHEPSLELIAAYLNKWGKTNPNDSEKRNILKVQLVESEYCYGVFDTLTIERYMGKRDPINPVMLLAFIEGVLGYQLINTTGGCKTYTSTTLLK